MQMNKLSALMTEMRNEHSMKIDSMSTSEILTVINQEDQKVALAVQAVLRLLNWLLKEYTIH